MKRVSLPNTGRDVLITDRAAIVSELFRRVDIDFYSRGEEAKVERLEGRMDRLENYVAAMIHRMPESELVGLLTELGFTVVGRDSSAPPDQKSAFLTQGAVTARVEIGAESCAQVGFWYSEEERHLPVPTPGQSPVDPSVIAKIVRAQAVAHQRHYKGSSRCRICGKRNGSSEFRMGNFVWPEGYIHYLEEHDVPVDFQFQMFLERNFQ